MPGSPAPPFGSITDPPAYAITYTGAGGLFTEIGKAIGAVNCLKYVARNLLSQIETDVLAVIEPGRIYVYDGMTEACAALDLAILVKRRAILEFIKRRLQDRPTIVYQLGLDSDDINLILVRLREKMVADAKTVRKNVVTIAAVAAGPTNIGNGTVITTTKLDGYSAPGLHFPEDKKYAGLETELSAMWETITLECIADSQNSAANGSAILEGGETFRVFGNPMNPDDADPTPYFGHNVEGSGEASVKGGNGANVITNGSMDTWTDAVPPVLSSWTIDSGVNNVNFIKEEVVIYRSTGASLQLKGDGTATIKISNAPAVSAWRPLRRYLVSVRYKADAAVAAGTFGVEFSGTGYAVGADKISVAAGAIPTAWTLANFIVQTPSVIPSDWKLNIQVTGTLTAGRIIYVDDVIVQPIVYFDGVGFAFVPGSTPAMKRDRWTFLVENDRAGIIQSFWGRAFGRQLPSATSGAENVLDSLCDLTEVPTFQDSTEPI
jgi:hypothetical protein